MPDLESLAGVSNPQSDIEEALIANKKAMSTPPSMSGTIENVVNEVRKLGQTVGRVPEAGVILADMFVDIVRAPAFLGGAAVGGTEAALEGRGLKRSGQAALRGGQEGVDLLESVPGLGDALKFSSEAAGEARESGGFGEPGLREFLLGMAIPGGPKRPRRISRELAEIKAVARQKTRTTGESATGEEELRRIELLMKRRKASEETGRSDQVLPDLGREPLLDRPTRHEFRKLHGIEGKARTGGAASRLDRNVQVKMINELETGIQDVAAGRLRNPARASAPTRLVTARAAQLGDARGARKPFSEVSAEYPNILGSQAQATFANDLISRVHNGEFTISEAFAMIAPGEDDVFRLLRGRLVPTGAVADEIWDGFAKAGSRHVRRHNKLIRDLSLSDDQSRLSKDLDRMIEEIADIRTQMITDADSTGLLSTSEGFDFISVFDQLDGIETPRYQARIANRMMQSADNGAADPELMANLAIHPEETTMLQVFNKFAARGFGPKQGPGPQGLQ